MTAHTDVTMARKGRAITISSLRTKWQQLIPQLGKYIFFLTCGYFLDMALPRIALGISRGTEGLLYFCNHSSKREKKRLFLIMTRWGGWHNYSRTRRAFLPQHNTQSTKGFFCFEISYMYPSCPIKQPGADSVIYYSNFVEKKWQHLTLFSVFYGIEQTISMSALFPLIVYIWISTKLWKL